MGRDLRYENLGFAMVHRDRRSNIDPDRNMLQVFEAAEPDRMRWSTDHQTVDTGEECDNVEAQAYRIGIEELSFPLPLSQDFQGLREDRP